MPTSAGLNNFDQFHVATVQNHSVNKSHVEKRGQEGNVNWSNQPLDTVLTLDITPGGAQQTPTPIKSTGA